MMKIRQLVRHILRVAQILVGASLLGSCASSGLRVESFPEGVEVLANIGAQPPRKIGLTPLTVSESVIGNGGESFQLVLSKDGYLPENILIPPGSFARTTIVRATLKEVAIGAKPLNDQTLQKIASGVAQAQQLIVAKQYEQGEQLLYGLVAQFPGVSTFHELLGNIAYLKKDLARAMAAYRKAVDINPANVDTQRMINKIEMIRGDRLPANAGAGR